ncbi:hypothetical protein [Aliikangiella coralliicola]|uniref:STAS/SEC14 domain-containing protein n=1 Tax=Aliikangiella coralliicola TaxID=2592383 RepID=A0A545UJH6_9GAMM|nr:hypothetical protein [Aliikangiella coralliicola]TQV89616.1 hypothetical protein FLL46_01660 [Aliikangiella coralliicola]
MASQKQQQQASSLTITINQTGDYADLIFDGPVTKELLNESFVKLTQHPQFKFNINACYDYLNAYPEIGMAEIEEHAYFVSSHLNNRGFNYKLAMVANDTLCKALLSVYKLLISKTPVDAQVFTCKTEAIRWLMSED